MGTSLLFKACPRCTGDMAQTALEPVELHCLQCGYYVWMEPPAPATKPPKTTHYVAGWGSYGCLYDGCGCYDSLEDAVQDVAGLFSLGPVMRGTLRKARYVDLGARYGADYAEIVDCACTHKEVHDA